ncbi:MAG: nitroreductase family protein [Eggerthellaceae bacterium]
MLIEIDERYCVGCGRCVDDCVGANLALEDGIARVKGRCILCGHCVAVCPTGAVSIPSYDMEDVEICVPASAAIDPRTMLGVIKSRRSVRNYLPNAIGQDALRLVLDAGRYTATAKNAQGCRFIVVQDELDELKRLVWGGIEDALALSGADKPRWATLYEPFLNGVQAGQQDFLFRNAPAVAFVAASAGRRAGRAEHGARGGIARQSCSTATCAARPRSFPPEGVPRSGGQAAADMHAAGPSRRLYRRTAPRRAGDFVMK